MKHLLSSITLLLLSTLAFGQVPNTFSSGETISSSKINANFAFLADSIKNDNITAMMVCKTSGYKPTDNTFYFGDCFSTENQAFETISTLRKSYFQSYMKHIFSIKSPPTNFPSSSTIQLGRTSITFSVMHSELALLLPSNPPLSLESPLGYSHLGVAYIFDWEA